MLKTRILHPEMLAALARAGHGARVLIADGNYPFSTAAPASAQRVFLNLTPGLLKVTDVLAPLVATIPIETAAVMTPPDGTAVPIHKEFLALLPPGTTLARFTRFEFYEQAMAPQTCLVIATGEQRRFANLLLTIGVIKAEDQEK